MINQRLNALRKKMAKRSLDAYIIMSSDPHQSEYLADHYKSREFISGFTGSAGLVVVTKDEAILWTDGRYFIQAENELATSEVKLYKMGVSGVPTYIEYLNEKLPIYGKIGFNGSCVSFEQYRKMVEKLDGRTLITNLDFISEIWDDQPALPKDQAYILEASYTGMEAKEKVKNVRHEMSTRGVEYYLIGSLEDICYLYNIRGNDVLYVPVVFSYALITQKEANLYIDIDKVDEDTRSYLENNGITIKRYDAIYADLQEIPGKKSIFIDPERTNVALVHALHSNVNIIQGVGIVTEMKAVKNSVEIENIKNAFIKDGVALVQFLNWVETGVPTGNVTEMTASDKLLSFRKEKDLFIEPSFSTISAYGANASMPHYSPSYDHPVVLKPQGLYLVDSGGHYYDGTTDITRTIALGALSDDEKRHYTMTLKSHIHLMTAKWIKGTKSSYLDAFARYTLYKEGLNFNHGTGHGVGFVLSVHEGPQRIAAVNNDVDMVPGMVVSVEPGIYVHQSHGIRIENIVVCVEDETNDFGAFQRFENLSYCPIDTRPVIVELLEGWEREWLNEYNQQCFDKLSPHLSGAALHYLEKQTESL